MSANDYKLGRLDGELLAYSNIISEFILIQDDEAIFVNCENLKKHIKERENKIYKLLDDMRIKANVPECSCHEKKKEVKE